MNKSNGIFQNRNTLILVIALLAIVCLEAKHVVVLINRKPEAKPDDASTSSAVVSENKGEINTPVGKLVFPSEWADSVEIKDTSSGKQFRNSFYGTVNGEKVLLFELSVGADGSGYQLGSAPDSAGNTQFIWLNIKEISSEPTWSGEDISRINTMQSCVNDLIEQLHEIDGFRESN